LRFATAAGSPAAGRRERDEGLEEGMVWTFEVRVEIGVRGFEPLPPP
jgi:hypothetical protein